MVISAAGDPPKDAAIITKKSDTIAKLWYVDAAKEVPLLSVSLE